MKFLKKNIKFIAILVIEMIIVSTVSVYAAYSYLAQDVSYTKSDGTEISVKEALDQLYAKENVESIIMGFDLTGFYADVDDDGTVDGVIFVDLAKGASGNWNPGNNSWAASNNTGVYSYSAVTSGLRSYKISTKISSYSGKFGTKPVIAPNGTSGNARFYVMALSDYDTSTHTWSDARYKTQTVGSVTFRLPSKEEWAAFGGQLGINTSNYSSSYGLSRWYWSSTERASSYAWGAYVNGGYMNYFDKTYDNYVRLCATF